MRTNLMRNQGTAGLAKFRGRIRCEIGEPLGRKYSWKNEPTENWDKGLLPCERTTPPNNGGGADLVRRPVDWRVGNTCTNGVGPLWTVTGASPRKGLSTEVAAGRTQHWESTSESRGQSAVLHPTPGESGLLAEKKTLRARGVSGLSSILKTGGYSRGDSWRGHGKRNDSSSLSVTQASTLAVLGQRLRPLGWRRRRIIGSSSRGTPVDPDGSGAASGTPLHTPDVGAGDVPAPDASSPVVMLNTAAWPSTAAFSRSMDDDEGGPGRPPPSAPVLGDPKRPAP
ncbi:hypothetical protein WN55_11244 [Dufourea novaeangliae]|uniref:Uncharacterized protein n=1 Tax=Dufourea novaeangliae TaxID=178035 RepID=A0A154PAS9_DUFNO|nr:hypothetical protein WN55_11244 [Dufourea novaeangliae]